MNQEEALAAFRALYPGAHNAMFRMADDGVTVGKVVMIEDLGAGHARHKRYRRTDVTAQILASRGELIPEEVAGILQAALEARDEMFAGNDEAFGDYTQEDREEHARTQALAYAWLDSVAPSQSTAAAPTDAR